MSVKLLTLTESELLLVSRVPNFSVCRSRLCVSASLSCPHIIPRCVTCVKHPRKPSPAFQPGHLTTVGFMALNGHDCAILLKGVQMGALQDGRVRIPVICEDSPWSDKTTAPQKKQVPEHFKDDFELLYRKIFNVSKSN